VRKMKKTDRLLSPSPSKRRYVVSFDLDLDINDVILLWMNDNHK
jgi:hypothetical protein